MNVLAIVQARMGSSRFPGKVLCPINGVPMIGFLLQRLSASKFIDHIVLATSIEEKDQPLAAYVQNIGFEVFKGSENDVLDRFYCVAKDKNPQIIVRITGDCPFVDPAVVDSAISCLNEHSVEYVSNIDPPTFPHGLDVEVFTFEALSRAWKHAESQYDREHVTPFIREHKNTKKYNLTTKEDYSACRLTVDEKEDLDTIKNVCRVFAPRTDFSWEEVIQCYKTDASLFSANQHLSRRT
jgi:glutamate-1-semialdehyde 2,1-aminomutase